MIDSSDMFRYQHVDIQTMWRWVMSHFTALHECRRILAMRILSVRLSVCQMRAL